MRGGIGSPPATHRQPRRRTILCQGVRAAIVTAAVTNQVTTGPFDLV